MKPGADPTLDLVREAARERDPLEDPRWEALARGELSPEQAEELRRADPEAFEALRPMDELTQRRMVGRAVESLAGEPVPLHVEIPPVARKGWRRGVAIAMLAAASATVLYIPVSLIRGQDEPAPVYLMMVSGGEREVRSGQPVPGAVPRMTTPETKVEIWLRPITAFRADVAWKCALEGKDGLRPWEPGIQPTPDGVIAVAGTRSQLFPGVPDGLWTIVCEIGRPPDRVQRITGKVQLGGDAG
jgi:hypothetical protein